MSDFQTVDTVRAQQLTKLASDLSSLYNELAEPRAKKQFSLTNAVIAMSERRLNGTFEGDVLRAVAAAQGESFNPQSVVLPIGLLATRGLSVSVTSAGGNLVGAKCVFR